MFKHAVEMDTLARKYGIFREGLNCAVWFTISSVEEDVLGRKSGKTGRYGNYVARHGVQ